MLSLVSCVSGRRTCAKEMSETASLKQVIDETEQGKLDSDIQEEISLHLQNLHDSFHEYFLWESYKKRKSG